MEKNNWFYKVFFMTFFLSIIFSTVSNLIAYNVNIISVCILLFVVIFIGIIFDMIGTSILISKETTFHAMSSKKLKGAKESLAILKKKGQISNLCLDVFGDISGIASGSLGAVLSFSLSNKFNISLTIVTIVIGSLVSAFTVGGKSLFKELALKKADKITLGLGKTIAFLKLK